MKPRYLAIGAAVWAAGYAGIYIVIVRRAGQLTCLVVCRAAGSWGHPVGFLCGRQALQADTNPRDGRPRGCRTDRRAVGRATPSPWRGSCSHRGCEPRVALRCMWSHQLTGLANTLPRDTRLHERAPDDAPGQDQPGAGEPSSCTRQRKRQPDRDAGGLDPGCDTGHRACSRLGARGIQRGTSAR